MFSHRSNETSDPQWCNSHTEGMKRIISGDSPLRQRDR